jgi:membrane protein DedA with SNARE-associated domain
MSGSLVASAVDGIARIIAALGYPGVTALMTAQSSGIPIPSEVIMPFTGFLVFQGQFTLWGAILAGTVGSIIGSVIAYLLGRYGGRPLLLRYGKYVFISTHDLEITERFFTRFGSASVFLGKLLPVVNTFVGWPAGIAKLSFGKFILYVSFGSLIWNSVLAYAGFKLGGEWLVIRDKLQTFDWYIIGAIILVGIWWVYRHFKHR